MKSLNESPDPSYTSVNLSIYAIAEVFVGVFTACLPPLRKTFDECLRKMLPAGLMSSRATKSRDSYALDGALKAFSNPSKATQRSKIDHESDGDSDYAILEQRKSKGSGSHDEIMKTTQVSITVDDKASEREGNDRWV
jgi:hypothetical protein